MGRMEGGGPLRPLAGAAPRFWAKTVTVKSAVNRMSRMERSI
jgi:hypothetical protein